MKWLVIKYDTKSKSEAVSCKIILNEDTGRPSQLEVGWSIPDYQHYPPCISLTTHHLTQMAPGSTGNMHCLEEEWKLTEQKVKALATYLAFSN